ITAISEDNAGSPGAFEHLTFDGGAVTTTIQDTVDTVTVHLTVDRTEIEEGDPALVYTVTLRDANGQEVAANNNVTVTTQLGTVTIAAGSSSASFSVPVQGDDIYVDPEIITNVITGVTEANAGSP